MTEKLKLDFTNSTRAELLKLEEKFPNVLELRGSVIKWDELETALNMRRSATRFKIAIAAWRKRLKKQGVWVRGNTSDVVGVGLRVLTDEEQVHFSRDRYRQAGRRIVDGHAASANADDSKLSPQARAEKDHNILAGRHLHAAVIESRRFIPKVTEPAEMQPKREAD